MKIAVIGAGAAGLMAAACARKMGAEVILIEKNEKPGKKIYITGKGRCNVTNACDIRDYFPNIISNPKFMYKSLYAFDNRALMDFIEDNGTPLKTERGGRVFPVSDHASDITRALLKPLKKTEIRLDSEVVKILIKDDTAIGVKLKSGEKIQADRVILACGGASYPGAGGGRSGYKLCEDLGITVTNLRPGLVPFTTKEEYVKDLQGLSLKNVNLTIKKGDRVLYNEFGEMLFTHFGISGPLVLSASSLVGDVLSQEKSLSALIDLKPAIPENELDERLLKLISENGKKNTGSFFQGLLPKSLQPVMTRLWGIDTERKIQTINKKERLLALRLLKEFPLTLTGMRGFKEAIITRGGVSVKEINPSTMESKKIKNLYICGEMVDVDALTGGFNLQCAFSMGYLAGTSCLKGED